MMLRKIISLTVILSFIFSPITPVLSYPDTLRRQAPIETESRTGTVAGLKKDLQEQTGTSELPPLDLKDPFKGPGAQSVFEPINRKVNDAHGQMSKNPTKARKLLEEAVNEYEALLETLTVGSDAYKKAQENLAVAQLWLTRAKLTILHVKKVKKWNEEDFRTVQNASRSGADVSYLRPIFEQLFEAILHLDVRQLRRYAKTTHWSRNKYNESTNIEETFQTIFQTIALLIENPEVREVISKTDLDRLKERLRSLGNSDVAIFINKGIITALAAIGPEVNVKYALSEETAKNLETLSNILREDILKMLFNAGSGHPGGSLSAAEIFSTLYFSGILNHDPNDPKWENRDRVVVSAGHKAPAVYATLAEAGYFSKAEFANLRKTPEAMLQGHIDMHKTPGVDWSTGALGQGFSAACGMAAAAQLQKKDLHVWSILGGGEEQEGQISEAARHAAKVGLTNLTAILDDNGYQIEGSGEQVDAANVAKVWQGYGWNVITVSGHNVSQLYDAMQRAKNNKDKPTLIIAKTQKGKGVKYFEENPTESHGAVPKDETIRKQALEDVKIALADYSPAEIEGFIRSQQLNGSKRSIVDKKNGKSAIAKPAGIVLKELEPGDKIATRAAFGEMMNFLGSANPNLAAMSADLQPSANLVKFEDLYGLMSPKNQQGRYVALGIREAHGASFAAGMSSMGIIPVVATFDIFSLNMVPQIRTMVQAGVPVIFEFTHSGVGVGEDGTSHQSIEAPGVMDILSGPLGDKMDIYEPADAQDTRVVLQNAISSKKPVYIRLTRQDVPVLDTSSVANYEQKVLEGSYIVRDPGRGKNDLIIVATGATVAEALKASEELEKEKGLKVKVINIVSINKIDNPDNPFQSYLENGAPIITVCDAVNKVLQNPVLRAAELMRQKGVNIGNIHPFGVTILGSGSPKELYALNGLDAAGIKKSALAISSSTITPVAIPTVAPPAIPALPPSRAVPFIAGNWKMEKGTKEEAITLLREIAEKVKDTTGAEIVISPSPIHLIVVADALRELEASGEITAARIKIAAQNVSGVEKGAQTGRTGILQLKDAGTTYVIIGHSEQRRDKSNKINEVEKAAINAKVKLALANGLIPILCVGESLEEREAGQATNIVESMVKEDLEGLSAEDMRKVVIAYEPVWAIGTNKNATPEQAQEMNAFVRKLVETIYSPEAASQIIILYGGSVKPDNAQALYAQPDIDGFLIGGASLKADGFASIAQTAVKENTLKLVERGVIPSPLLAFKEIGEEIWVDGVTWDMIQSGKFEKLVRIHGITGVTTNPPLIKAYLKDKNVLAKAAKLAAEGKGADEVYFELIKDLATRVIDTFKKCNVQGKFSVEIDPTKANDVEASVKEAMKWLAIAPEYMMVKVAANETGYKIMEEVTARGGNVNATLIFTPEQYEKVAMAYIRGLVRASKAGLDLSKIYSVASFFISRWDVKLYKAIPEEQQGMFANSIAIVTYAKFQGIFYSPEFGQLKNKGANLQKFLIASSGSKADKLPADLKHLQSAYPADVYVHEVQGPDVINTLPIETISFLITQNMQQREATIIENFDLARKILSDKTWEKINLAAAGDELFQEGLASFVKDFRDIQATIGGVVKEAQVNLALENITELMGKASSVLKIEDVRETVLGSFGLTQDTLKDDSTAYVFSTAAVFDENGLGALILALANRGVQIAVVVKEGNTAQDKVIAQINSAITDSENKLMIYESVKEAVDDLRDNNGFEKITYVATSEEAPEGELLNVDKIIKVEEIIKLLGTIKTLQEILVDFKSACEVIGTRV